MKLSSGKIAQAESGKRKFILATLQVISFESPILVILSDGEKQRIFEVKNDCFELFKQCVRKQIIIAAIGLDESKKLSLFDLILEEGCQQKKEIIEAETMTGQNLTKKIFESKPETMNSKQRITKEPAPFSRYLL